MKKIQGGPKISKPLPIYQQIALKPAKEIRFFRQLEVSNKYYNIITRY